MSDYNKNEKLSFYNERKLESGKMWILFLFLGWSYGSMGQMGKQIFFYLTLGGFGLWMLYVLFTLSSKVKKFNKNVARQVGLNEEDIAMLGLI
jgi:hypothetical protein